MVLTDTTPFVVLLAVMVAALLLGLAVVGAGLVRAIPVQRRTRLARRESVTHYYGQLLLGR